MVEVVAALVHDTENPRRFLICQRPAHKARGLLWEFVGGKVEPGETKREALARECREELGVAVSVGDVYMELTHVYPDLTIHLTLFHAEITDGVPQLLEHCAISARRTKRFSPGSGLWEKRQRNDASAAVFSLLQRPGNAGFI